VYVKIIIKELIMEDGKGREYWGWGGVGRGKGWIDRDVVLPGL
jgi:hypothetical protein